MTPEERAKAALEYRHSDLLIYEVERAIIAAIEEDRKTRPHMFVGSHDRYCEWCNEPDRHENHLVPREWANNVIKQEREASARIAEECARLLDKQARGYQVLIDHAPTPIRAEDLKRVKYSIEHVADLIRARSESKEERGERWTVRN
jgi:hypothetical protein